ncbi:MAG TPA: agmatinase [Candidatus Hypogeohydataceae bacterium YC38]|nr:agmatinase [Candidatus Brocadiales bacterium]
MSQLEFVPYNFGALPEESSSLEKSRVVILPVPYDSTSSYKAGARDGPRAIINASRNMELFDEELLEDISLVGIHTLPELMPDCHGPERTIQKVYQATREMLEQGKILVTLGGEHSISLGSIRAYKERYPGLSVLQIDAHLDLRGSYAGTPYNHACVMRRVSELCPLTQVGIRSFSEEEYDFVKEKGLEPFYQSLINNWGDWPEEVIERLSREVYVTIDLDGLDPSIMPSVGTPEPGGLGWHETLRLLKRVAEKRKVVGFDVMELCPDPTNVAPDFLAARLIYKLIGYSFRK